MLLDHLWEKLSWNRSVPLDSNLLLHNRGELCYRALLSVWHCWHCVHLLSHYLWAWCDNKSLVWAWLRGGNSEAGLNLLNLLLRLQTGCL